MTQMTPQQVRVVDPVLSQVALGYRHPEHVGMYLFPPVPVQVSGGQILEFGKESFRLYNSLRAPGAATKRVQFGHQGKPYALANHSLEGQVPREHLRDASRVPGVDLATRAVRSVMATMSLALEYEQATLARDASQYDADHKVDVSSAPWSDAENGDPAGDIEAGKEAIRASVGIYPNTLLLSAKAFAACKRHPAVVDRVKYTSRDSITPEMLAQMWDLQRVVVGRAIVFSDDGQSIDVWGDDAILAYVPEAPAGMEEPSYGYTYHMEGHPLVEEPYYDANAKSWIYPVTYERAPVLTGITSGYLIQHAGA